MVSHLFFFREHRVFPHVALPLLLSGQLISNPFISIENCSRTVESCLKEIFLVRECNFHHHEQQPPGDTPKLPLNGLSVFLNVSFIVLKMSERFS